MPLKTYKIKDVQPNPFRHLDRYPIRPETVEKLRQSIRQTGWWEGGARGRETPDGKLELASGHHRLEALRAEYGQNHAVSFIVNPLSDEVMLQEMANENSDEYGSSVAHALTVVRSTVEGFAEDKYPNMKTPDAKTNKSDLRYAPSFQLGCGAAAAQHPYTAETVAGVLGWMGADGRAKRKVKDALSALELIEEGALDEAEYVALGTREAESALFAARQARDNARARSAEAVKKAEDAEKKAVADRKKAEEAAAKATAAKKRQADDLVKTRQRLEVKRKKETEKREAEQRTAAAKAAGEAAKQRIKFEKEDKEKAQKQRREAKVAPKPKRNPNAGRDRTLEEEHHKLVRGYWTPKHPKTAAGDAARKAEGLLKKAASVDDIEADALLKKANQLIRQYELFVYVSSERLK